MPQPEQQQSPPGSEHDLKPKADHGEESYRGSGKLKDKIAIITGGDSGIGRAVAIAYAREGADLLIAYLSEDDDARDTQRLVANEGRRCILFPGDLADKAHCDALIDRAVAEFGRIDILVNNAAEQMTYNSIEDIPDEAWERTFAVNITAMFRLCKAATPHMKKGGSIINTSSINSDRPLPTLLPYATTKGAITTFSAALAQLLGERGIRVNAVAPGPIWTPLIPSTMPEEKVKSFGDDTPLKRAGQPRELAGIFVLLASDEASYMSGGLYAVTGGQPII
jgi:NAD(P)-dependent dehydrogenase (short-subunit alcohol dehydrogenase family)